MFGRRKLPLFYTTGDKRMLEWHDCKNNSPKEDGWYLLLCNYKKWMTWYKAYWNSELGVWLDYTSAFDEELCYKWTEVELSE